MDRRWAALPVVLVCIVLLGTLAWWPEAEQRRASAPLERPNSVPPVASNDPSPSSGSPPAPSRPHPNAAPVRRAPHAVLPAPLLHRAAATADTDGPEEVQPYPLDAQGIKDAITDVHEELKACYETALFSTPGLAGRLTLELHVSPSAPGEIARITTAHVQSDLDAPMLEGCISTVFEDLRFDGVEEATVVKYPVVFREEP